MVYGLRCRSAYALTVREECTRLAHKNYAMHSVRACDRHTAPARVRLHRRWSRARLLRYVTLRAFLGGVARN